MECCLQTALAGCDIESHHSEPWCSIQPIQSVLPWWSKPVTHACDGSDDFSACQTRVVVLIVCGFHAARRNIKHIHQLQVFVMKLVAAHKLAVGFIWNAARQDTTALSIFNDDGLFYRSVVSVSICLSVQPNPVLPLDALQSSKASRLPLALLSLHPRCSLIPLMRNVSDMAALGSEGRRLVQRYSGSEVASSIPQTLLLFNVSATRRSLLMASSNPLPPLQRNM